MPKSEAKSTLEKVCRALCAHANNPPDIQFEGRPMWMSYQDEAMAILTALETGDEFVGKNGAQMQIVVRN